MKIICLSSLWSKSSIIISSWICGLVWMVLWWLVSDIIIYLFLCKWILRVMFECNLSLNSCVTILSPVLWSNRWALQAVLSPRPPHYPLQNTINVALQTSMLNEMPIRFESIPETWWLFNIHGWLLITNNSSLFIQCYFISFVWIRDTKWNPVDL
jgi:hypothetical protein